MEYHAFVSLGCARIGLALGSGSTQGIDSLQGWPSEQRATG